MTIGRLISKLIEYNIQNWHHDTKLKDSTGQLKKDLDIPNIEVAEIFLKARLSNSNRSRAKEMINDFFGQGTGETKINYFGEIK